MKNLLILALAKVTGDHIFSLYHNISKTLKMYSTPTKSKGKCYVSHISQTFPLDKRSIVTVSDISNKTLLNQFSITKF